MKGAGKNGKYQKEQVNAAYGYDLAPGPPAPGQGANNSRSRGDVSAQRSRWHMSVNSKLVSIANTGNFAALISAVAKYLPDMNLVNITTAIHRLAKLVAGDARTQATLVSHPVMGSLLTAAQVKLASISSHGGAPSCQALSNIMWSMAVLNVSHWELLRDIVSLSVTCMESFKPLELSTLLWASAKIGPQGEKHVVHWADSVFEAAVVYIHVNVQEFSFRNLATTVGAYATIGKSSPRMFHAVALQMPQVIHTANSLELAKTAWAFGTANVHNEKLFASLARCALQDMQAFQQHELSNLLWGFASNEVFHQKLFMKASLCAQHMELNAQQLANILWAITRMRPQPATTCATVRALLPQCVKQLGTFKPQEFASAALAVAKAFGHVGDELGKIDEHLPQEVHWFFASAFPVMFEQLHEFSDQSLANVATAFIAVRASGAALLLARVGQIVLQRMEKLEPPVLLQLIRAFTTEEFDAPPSEQNIRKVVAQALFRQVVRRLDRFQQEEQRSLGRLVCRVLHIQQDVNTLSIEDLRQCCMSLCSGGEMHSDNPVQQQRKQNKQQAAPAASSGPRMVSISQALNMNAEEEPPADSDQESKDGSNAGSRTSKERREDIQDQCFKVKNTFIEFEQLYGQNVLEQAHQKAISKPAWDFLSHRTWIAENPTDMATVQAVRVDYQCLKAVRGLDYPFERPAPQSEEPDGSTTFAGVSCHSQGVWQKDSVTADDDGASVASEPTKFQPLPDMKDRLISAQLEFTEQVKHREFVEATKIQAFRRDYRDMRAVPGVDWLTSNSSWLGSVVDTVGAIQREEGSTYAYDRRRAFPSNSSLKQNEKRSTLNDLGPPLAFLDQSEEIQTLRKVYQTDLTICTPGVDFFPSKVDTDGLQPIGQEGPRRVNPSRWLLEADAPFRSAPLKPGVLQGPPISVLGPPVR